MTGDGEKRLGLLDCISIIVGIVIGTTIFELPWLIFANTPNVWMGLLARGRPTPVVSLYRPRDALIAVRPLPNRSYETPSRGFRSFQLGMSCTAAKSRAGTKLLASTCCAGTHPLRCSNLRPRLSVSRLMVHRSWA